MLWIELRYMLLVIHVNLVPRPYQRMREKLGRTGRFGDVIMMYLPPFLQTMTEVVHVSSLHHQINRYFSHALKDNGKNLGLHGGGGVRGQGGCGIHWIGE